LAIKIDAPASGSPSPQLQWRLPKTFAALAAERTILDQLEQQLAIKAGDLVLMVGGDRLQTCHVLGKMRSYVAQACQAKGLLRLVLHFVTYWECSHS
jgi:aspartyl-tRNA synthetase